MRLDTPKKIKNRLTEIYNEELLNYNIFLSDDYPIFDDRNLREHFLNRIKEEFDYINDDVFETISLFLSVPTFYIRAEQKIIEASLFPSEKEFYEDYILKIEDETPLIDIAYNHKNPKLRSLALMDIEKEPILIDFILNDPEPFIRQQALFQLFGEEFMNSLSDCEYFGKIPIEIEFELDYEDVKEDFGIEETVFEKRDKLIISEISFKGEEMIIHTDPKNSYEHAVSEISNQDALKSIASYHNKWSVRNIAIPKIYDEDYLLDILKNGFDKETKPRRSSILVAPGEITEWIVLESTLERLLEIKKLGGEDLQNFVLDLYWQTKEPIIQNICLTKIDNDELLINIGTEEANPNQCRIILEELKDQDYLILFSLDILINPKFDGPHYTFDEKLLIFDSRDYQNLRFYACRALVSIPKEDLNKSLKDLSPKIDLKNLEAREYFENILEKPFKDILIDIAKTNESSSVRSIAVSAIDDKEALIDIALSDESNDVACEALKNIDDDDFRNDYVTKYNKATPQIFGANLIQDQSVLEYIAKNDPWWGTREYAIENLENQELLEDIAKNDPEWSVRSTATRKIMNQTILTDIAYNDPNHLVKQFAISRIENKEILEDLIFKNESFTTVREIIEKIDNQEIFKDLALNSSNPNIRSSACSKIKDHRFLVDRAINDEEWLVRYNILVELTRRFIHQSSYEKQNNEENKNNNDELKVNNEENKNNNDELKVNNEENKNNNDGLKVNNEENKNNNDGLKVNNEEKNNYIDANSIILYEDEDPYTLQSLILDRAYNDSSEKVRGYAILQINDEEILYDIAMNDSNTDVRLSAIDRIDRNELLAKIFVKSKNHHVYRKAISKIKYEYILLKLVNMKHYYGELWQKEEMAKSRLNELGFHIVKVRPFGLRRKKKFFRPVFDLEKDEFNYLR